MLSNYDSTDVKIYNFHSNNLKILEYVNVKKNVMVKKVMDLVMGDVKKLQ